MTDKELLQEIKELMQRKLLTQAELDDPAPWGEDSNMYSFNYGKPHGAHELAESVLNLMGVEIVLEEGDRWYEDEDK